MNQSCIIWPDEINDIVNATQSCKSLLHLELSKGNFSITECLQNVTTLKILNVSQCSGINDDKAKELSTVISKNSSLVSLDISHNRLTTFGATQIAKALQSVTTLQTFVLNNCEITDEAAKHIATAISYNPQLTELNISWNKLSGVGTSKIIQCLENCNQLQTIKFAACGVTSKETEAIATMLSDKTNLRELDISWNGLKADGITAIMKAICNISYLQVLKFNNCDITDKAAETIASTLVAYYTLMELTICHNDFSPSGVATVINSLQSTSTIKVLTTSNCLFDNSSDDIATAIGNNCGLVHLEIYHSHFTTHGARLFSRSFTNIHILQHLKLINCNITEEVAGEIATVLAQNKTIEHLDLSHNPLAAGVTEIVRVLLYNQILQVLILQSCSITDESAFDLVTFAKSTSLVEFDILQNQLTDNGSFIVAKGFMDSLTIKVLKIRDWYKIFHEGNYEDDNYVLDSLRGKHVSLHLE
ncbi:ribonuclease inhibitor-like [Dysidea avara]|uniref:ribonuclease inhibitor-like n=1 Tax=Dysidea avara TaxID=196820 RepID=UPI003333071A